MRLYLAHDDLTYLKILITLTLFFSFPVSRFCASSLLGGIDGSG